MVHNGVSILKNNIESREASDKYKGFRYQKLRLARKMMQLLKINKDAYIIGFPEYKDDSFILGEGSKVFEQNKEYSDNFTLNSKEIRKAVLNFLENYLESRKDPNLVFIFHTNVNYSKERKSTMLNSLGLKPLEFAVLQYLVNREYTDNLINFVTKVILYTSEEGIKEETENKDKDEESKDNNLKEINTLFLEQVSKMNNEDWIKFLKCIYFEFGQPNLKELETELLDEIKSCPFYSELHIGRENEIKNALLEMIDKRMAETELLKKAFTSDALKNVYLESCHKDKTLPFDPIYEFWEEIESEKETKSKKCTNYIKKLIMNTYIF